MNLLPVCKTLPQYSRTTSVSEYPFISYTYTGIKQQIAGSSNMLRLGILLISIQLQGVGIGSFHNTSAYISQFVSSSLSINYVSPYGIFIFHSPHKSHVWKVFDAKIIHVTSSAINIIILVVLPIFIQRQANKDSNITQKLYLF